VKQRLKDAYIIVYDKPLPYFYSLPKHIQKQKIRSMKKLILCVCASLIVAFPIKPALAGESISTAKSEAAVNNYISGVYKQLDLGSCDPLSFDAFSTAYRGYLNLLNAGKLNMDKGII